MISARCPHCGATIRCKEEDAGKKARCDRCQGLFSLPRPQLPAVVPVRDPARRRSQGVGFICPFCGTDEAPYEESRVSALGWYLFIVLLLSCVFTIFCWLALLVRDNYRVCSQCGMRLGQHG
jgi:hypothetical protein